MMEAVVTTPCEGHPVSTEALEGPVAMAVSTRETKVQLRETEGNHGFLFCVYWTTRETKANPIDWIEVVFVWPSMGHIGLLQETKLGHAAMTGETAGFTSNWWDMQWELEDLEYLGG